MQYVKFEIVEGLGIVSLNRPDRRNGLGDALTRELKCVLEAIAVDPAVRAVLLRGEGPSFCVGGDISEMDHGGQERFPFHERVSRLRDITRIVEMLHGMRKVTVCAMHGAAAGAGLSLGLACDIRIASASTKITTAFAKVGLAGDFGGAWLATRLLGSARARELYFLSPVISGSQAYHIGLVTEAVPDDELERRSREIALALASGPSAALASMKDNLNQAERSDFGASLDVEAINQTLASITEDHREAARAFLEKRPPNFVGR